MGSKKSKAPPPSAQEKMAAAVGLAEFKIFNDLYMGDETRKGPLLKMRDQAQREDFTKLFQGRAGADLIQQMQVGGLGGYAASKDITRAKTVGKALGKGKQKAASNALKAKANQQTAVLASARKQSAANMASLSNSARIDTGEILSGYQAKVRRQASQMATVTKSAGKVMDVLGYRAGLFAGKDEEQA
jgi:hypothetical protein